MLALKIKKWYIRSTKTLEGNIIFIYSFLSFFVGGRNAVLFLCKKIFTKISQKVFTNVNLCDIIRIVKERRYKMRYKARKSGNSIVLTIPSYIINILKIEEGDMLNIELDDNHFIVKKED